MRIINVSLFLIKNYIPISIVMKIKNDKIGCSISFNYNITVKKLLGAILDTGSAF